MQTVIEGMVLFIAAVPLRRTVVNSMSFCSQDAQSYADDNSLLFMETSAKTSMNVNEIFMAIGKWLSGSDQN